MIRDSFAPEWLTVRQVAQLSGYHERTVWRAIWDHKLRATQRVASGSYRIRVADYDAWMNGRAPQVERTIRRVG